MAANSSHATHLHLNIRFAYSSPGEEIRFSLLDARACLVGWIEFLFRSALRLQKVDI